jgi:SAM-dependent methyltransferase
METISDYWNNQPCNIKHSSLDIGTLEYFQEVEARKYYVESHIPVFAEFDKWRDKKVLEIGCGIGTDASNFSKNGAFYTGIELSEKSLEITKKRFEVFNLKGEFYNIDAQNIDDLYQVGNNFDLIYSFGVIHHSPNPQKIIDNCFLLLKPGGVLKIMVYAENSWKKMMIDGKLDQYEAQSNCPVAFTYTKEQIYDMFKQYNDIKIEQEHIFPYKIKEYKNYEYKKESWFENMPENIFKIMEKNLGWHLCITCKK